MVLKTGHSVPVEFEEAGIKPLAYGQPELAKATSYSALARQIERNGIQDEAGNDLAKSDKATAEALARQFVYPKGAAAAAFQAPIYKHLQAGTVALVHGPVLLTRVNPSPLNPRVGPMLTIPRPNQAGRVSVSWAPADVEVDPQADERLCQSAESADQLIAVARETSSKILGLQKDLAGVIGREGIEEPLLIVQSRLEIEGQDGALARHLVPVAADGGSRITIAQEYLAEAIGLLLSEKEREYATKHKRRAGLESLERALRAHQVASLVDDPVAERELRDFLVELEPARCRAGEEQDVRGAACARRACNGRRRLPSQRGRVDPRCDRPASRQPAQAGAVAVAGCGAGPGQPELGGPRAVAAEKDWRGHGLAPWASLRGGLSPLRSPQQSRFSDRRGRADIPQPGRAASDPNGDRGPAGLNRRSGPRSSPRSSASSCATPIRSSGDRWRRP